MHGGLAALWVWCVLFWLGWLVAWRSVCIGVLCRAPGGEV